MVVMVDGPMIRRFIENTEEFNKYADVKVKILNQKNEEKPTTISIPLDNHDQEEDGDDDGFVAVDLEKYKAEIREMMMAVAQGIGNTPVNVMVEEGSLLMKAYEAEVSRILKEEAEEKQRKMMKIEKEVNNKSNGFLHNNDDNNNKDKGEIVVVPNPRNNKSLKKKGSFNLLTFCACSGKQFVDK